MTALTVTAIALIILAIVALILLFAWLGQKREADLLEHQSREVAEWNDELIAERKELKAKLEKSKGIEKSERERRDATLRELSNAQDNVRTYRFERDTTRTQLASASKALAWLRMHTSGKQYRVVRVWPSTMKKDEQVEEIYVGHDLEKAKAHKALALTAATPGKRRSYVNIEVTVAPRWARYEEGDESGDVSTTSVTGVHLHRSLSPFTDEVNRQAKRLAEATSLPPILWAEPKAIDLDSSAASERQLRRYLGLDSYPYATIPQTFCAGTGA